MFGRRKPLENTNTIQAHVATVERILESLKVNPKDARRQMDNGGFGWSFRQGSATIEIYINQTEQEGYLQVLSPIMYLPASGLLPLYRRLLELNMSLTTAAFGVYLDTVYVFNERPLTGLDVLEAKHIIEMIAGYADELDNQLVAEFGGRLYGQV